MCSRNARSRTPLVGRAHYRRTSGHLDLTLFFDPDSLIVSLDNALSFPWYVYSFMKPQFPDLTFFLDAAGRYSHSKETPIVFSAVGMKTKNVDEVRKSLMAATKGNCLKWSESEGNHEMAKAIFRILAKRQLLWIARIICKNTPEWDRYFEDGQKLYDKCVKNAQEAASYAKPMNTFKLHQFGLASADLLGVYLGRHTHWLPRSDRPIQRISVNVVFDSDIHGETNRKICQNVFEGLEGDLPETVQATRIEPHFKVSISTEQAEPLLLLPDHMAGYLYSRKTYGVSDENVRRDLLTAVEPLFTQVPLPCYKIIEQNFQEEYLLPPTTFDHVLPKREREALLEALLGNKEATAQTDSTTRIEEVVDSR